ncbi:DUF853 domain-containing protein [Lichenihabitans sp. PAMC28606]|uniref:helicase HerA-like domain-containing protein n=1 Tax=Lichenihabitans sp. PAMC28606 TaxID=2880932 RepID=UPI001D0BB909|nr:helicase HerA-like domain-containing protein [Lichenihabitans sp. PAMC28606]UDL94849.1 DUF853 domain-containing protein [Lichenihabitans sp. PAMC28606]
MSTDTWDMPGTILVGKSATFERLTLSLGNRHGLVTGATGTGKTVTLQKLAEGFSNAGVPVIAADVKGDLAGIAMAGDGRAALTQRAAAIGIPYEPDRFPTVFWDVFGQQGHPIRATIAEMGPLLVARLLELNAVQEGVLNVAFKVADEQGLLLLDLKDLRSMLQYISEHAAELTKSYGNVAPATIGTIQRQLLVLEAQGATSFLGEPALDIMDFIATDRDGRGIVNILAADKLVRSPRLYATFLLWFLSELFQQLPEVGDPEKPKLVFFFDEAHLLFDNAPKSLMDAIEQVVRLIRSKGVGVYFVTQNPLDVPDTVLGQLSNRVQHALRAFTPRDQRAVKAAADTFRQNPAFDTASVITQLAVGEALVSMLQKDGTPEIVQRSLIAPPASRVGPITPAERQAIIDNGPITGKYDTAIDRDSAFEMLKARAEGRAASVAPGSGQPSSPQANVPQAGAPQAASQGGGLLGEVGGALGRLWNSGASSRGRLSTGQMVMRSALQSMARSVGTQVAREIIRGVLGGIQK